MDYIGAVQSIVTSTAQNDSDMFEINPRDERFLPFELSTGSWQEDRSMPSDNADERAEAMAASWQRRGGPSVEASGLLIFSEPTSLR